MLEGPYCLHPLASPQDPKLLLAQDLESRAHNLLQTNILDLLMDSSIPKLRSQYELRVAPAIPSCYSTIDLTDLGLGMKNLRSLPLQS